MAHNFKKLHVWVAGKDVAKAVYLLSKKLPDDEKYGLVSQIRRSAISIPSNIAEGSSRHSEKDYNRFLEFSLGSSFELETQYLIAKQVNFGDQQLISTGLQMLDEEQKMLMSFMNKLNK